MPSASVPLHKSTRVGAKTRTRSSIDLLAELMERKAMLESAPASDVPRHIVHLIKHCGYANGNVHVAVDLACVQSRAGHRVTFISDGGTFLPLLEQCGVQHINLNHDQGKPLSVLRTMWTVACFARRHKPYVMNAHMMSSALVGWVASLVSGVPLVTVVHNSFDKHSSIMRLGRRVIAVSLAERDSLLRKGYRSDRLVAVMNAPANSPREAFMDDHREIVLSSPAIVAINALHRRKGVFDLIEACTRLFTDLSEWKLYIAGEGPDSATLKKQVELAGLSDRIIFLGFVPAPARLLKQADIVVLASYADPCSLVIGEARAAGCAIVATDVGGTKEMLEYGRAGRLVPPGRPDALASVMRPLMEDDQERLALRRASLRGADVFNVERLVQDYATIYQQAQGGLSV